MDIIFSDEVPRYILLCFRIDDFNKSANDILKHSIKLVTIYLQFCKKEIQFGEFDEDRVVFDNLLKVKKINIYINLIYFLYIYVNIFYKYIKIYI